MTKPRKKLKEPGYEGSIISTVDIRISSRRTEKRSVRSKAGTFEWRYGRNSTDPLYLAGSQFAILWERAGTAAARSPDLTAAGGAQWRGLPDGRAAALDEVRETVRELGKLCSARLVDYCVIGLTTKQIATKYDVGERDMAPVLHQDLRACAMHFRFL